MSWDSTGLHLDLGLPEVHTKMLRGVAGAEVAFLWRRCRGMQKTSRVGWEEKRFPAVALEGPLVG